MWSRRAPPGSDVMADVALAAWEAWATVSQAGYGGLATRRGWWTKPAQQPTTVVTNSQQPPAKPQVFSTKPLQPLLWPAKNKFFTCIAIGWLLLVGPLTGVVAETRQKQAQLPGTSPKVDVFSELSVTTQKHTLIMDSHTLYSFFAHSPSWTLGQGLLAKAITNDWSNLLAKRNILEDICNPMVSRLFSQVLITKLQDLCTKAGSWDESRMKAGISKDPLKLLP